MLCSHALGVAVAGPLLMANGLILVKCCIMNQPHPQSSRATGLTCLTIT